MNSLTTLNHFFPATEAAFPRAFDWTAEFGWESDLAVGTAIEFLEHSIKLQTSTDGSFYAFSEHVRQDLTRQATNQQTAKALAMIDGFRFIIAQPVIHRTLAEGKLGDCYGWLLWAISRTHDPEQRVNHGEYRLPPFDGASAEMNDVAFELLVDWISSAFALAWKFGGLDQHCADYIQYCTSVAFRELGRGSFDKGLQACVSILNWATSRKHEIAESLTRTLLRLYRRSELSPKHYTMLGITFTTAASQWTDQSPSEWARETLENYRPHLVQHETVQLFAVGTNSLELWQQSKDEILEEVRKLAQYYYSSYASRIDALVALESRFSVLHPLLYGLCRFGSIGDIMEVLSAWYGRAEWQAPDSNILFVFANDGAGVFYVWKDGRWLAEHNEESTTLEDLLVAGSDALNEYFRGPEGDRLQMVDERLAGAPAMEFGTKFRIAAEQHYEVSQLVEHLPSEVAPRSLVIVPAHRDPLQALLAEHLGYLTPLEITFASPAENRTIRTVSIWPGSTLSTKAVVAMLETVARSAGWNSKVVEGTLDEAAFERFYLDEEPDLLWVIGHGEHSPYRPSETGLVMDGGTLLPMDHIASLQVPKNGRRLLVLNVCSAGSAHTTGGVASVGLGQSVVSPWQSVVAHQWPVTFQAALAFGCAFASRLRSDDPVMALCNSIDLLKNPEELLAQIASVSPDLEAITRLDASHVRSELSNILSWGCPIFLT